MKKPNLKRKARRVGNLPKTLRSFSAAELPTSLQEKISLCNAALNPA